MVGASALQTVDLGLLPLSSHIKNFKKGIQFSCLALSTTDTGWRERWKVRLCLWVGHRTGFFHLFLTDGGAEKITSAPINSRLNMVVGSPTPLGLGRNGCWPSRGSGAPRSSAMPPSLERDQVTTTTEAYLPRWPNRVKQQTKQELICINELRTTHYHQRSSFIFTSALHGMPTYAVKVRKWIGICAVKTWKNVYCVLLMSQLTWCNHGYKATRPNCIVNVDHVRISFSCTVKLCNLGNVEPDECVNYLQCRQSGCSRHCKHFKNKSL